MLQNYAIFVRQCPFVAVYFSGRRQQRVGWLLSEVLGLRPGELKWNPGFGVSKRRLDILKRLFCVPKSLLFQAMRTKGGLFFCGE
jgi:hypothetical protein